MGTVEHLEQTELLVSLEPKDPLDNLVQLVRTEQQGLQDLPDHVEMQALQDQTVLLVLRDKMDHPGLLDKQAVLDSQGMWVQQEHKVSRDKHDLRDLLGLEGMQGMLGVQGLKDYLEQLGPPDKVEEMVLLVLVDSPELAVIREPQECRGPQEVQEHLVLPVQLDLREQLEILVTQDQPDL